MPPITGDRVLIASHLVAGPAPKSHLETILGRLLVPSVSGGGPRRSASVIICEQEIFGGQSLQPAYGEGVLKEGLRQKLSCRAVTGEDTGVPAPGVAHQSCPTLGKGCQAFVSPNQPVTTGELSLPGQEMRWWGRQFLLDEGRPQRGLR